jgi:dTDP-L-rhamnose 4-epimerase
VTRILVTGGAGFIGSHLVPALVHSGFEVRVLDTLSAQVHGPVPSGLEWLRRPGIEFIRGSVTCEADVRAALTAVDAVVHLAAETGTGQSMYEIARYSAANVHGTALLADALANDKHHRVRRVVLASSRAIYGEGAYVCRACASERRLYPEARSAQQLAAHRWDPSCPSCGKALTAVPTREDDAVRPASIYAATKAAQEDLVRIACSALGIGYTTLRLQNVYGEGQSLNNPYTGVLSIFSTRIRRGLHLPIFEDGQETRDFVHVEDVARAFLSSLKSVTPANQVVNVGAGIGSSIADTAAQLSAAFGAPRNLVVTGEYRVGDIRHNCADIGRLRAVLDCEPQIGLQEGMKRFAAWVLTQPLAEDRLDSANAEMKARKLMG